MLNQVHIGDALSLLRQLTQPVADRQQQAKEK